METIEVGEPLDEDGDFTVRRRFLLNGEEVEYRMSAGGFGTRFFPPNRSLFPVQVDQGRIDEYFDDPLFGPIVVDEIVNNGWKETD